MSYNDTQMQKTVKEEEVSCSEHAGIDYDPRWTL